MKRYLIFGFLTILVVTLNFAFIIVLVKEDVNINYEVFFLLWIILITAAVGLTYMERNRKKRRMAAEQEEKIAPEDPLKPTPEEVSPTNLYKKKSLKKFKLILSEEFNDKLKPGFFDGYIKTEEFANDQVQAVYSNEDQLLGFISKNEEQLRRNLEKLYQHPIICWGFLVWKEEEQVFVLKAQVPVLYSDPELNRFKNLVALKKELLEMEESEEKLHYRLYLEKVENFTFLEESEATPSSLDYKIDPEIIVNYSQKLMAEKNWRELVELQEFPALLGRLKKPHKKEVLSAIKEANKKLQGF